MIANYDNLQLSETLINFIFWFQLHGLSFGSSHILFFLDYTAKELLSTMDFGSTLFIFQMTCKLQKEILFLSYSILLSFLVHHTAIATECEVI